MWCKYCRQDVPGLHAANQVGLRCARCLSPLSDEDDLHAAHAVHLVRPTDAVLGVGGSPSPVGAYPNFDDWAIDQHLRELQARVGLAKPPEEPAGSAALDARHQPQWQIHASHETVVRPHSRRSRRSRKLAFWTWPILTLGLLAFVCGAVLLGWSFASGQGELWNLGMPIIVAGQAGLLLGLVLQLERIWQSSRYAVRKLEQVDSQLHDLERTASMLGVTHGSPSQAFYSHMADQANPHLLLADLKGQLDMLALSQADGGGDPVAGREKRKNGSRIEWHVNFPNCFT